MVPYIENEYFCIDEESAFANLFNFLVKEMILVSSKKLNKGFENLRIMMFFSAVIFFLEQIVDFIGWRSNHFLLLPCFNKIQIPHLGGWWITWILR